MDELRVRLLGGLEVEGLSAAALRSRRARTLFAALACAEGAVVPIDTLLEVVWAERPPARARDQLGVLVSRLRGVVGAKRLSRTDAGLRLRADWVDLEEVDAQATLAAERLRAGDVLAARLAASMGLDLARGPLLPEHDGAWVEAPRAALERTLAGLQVVAAEAAIAVGDALGASAAASAALDHDGYDEAALRVLMRAHVAAGRPASALAAYLRVRGRLAEDLGVSPTAETEALHDQVVLGGDGGATHAPADGRRDRAHPLVQRARTELAATDFDAAWRDAQEAVRRDGGAGASEVAGWVAYYRRDFASALHHAEVGAASAHEEERRASCLTLVGRVRHSQGELEAADAALAEASRCAVAGVRGSAEVWLAVLRNHQGRPREALTLVEGGAVDEASLRHPFVLPQAVLARVYALGQLGEVADALDALGDALATLDDLGPAGDRYQAACHNFTAWILLGIGRVDDAHRHSEAALVAPQASTEPRNNALLDLATAAVDEGDSLGAARLLERLDLEHDRTMGWHQAHRRELLQARLDLVDDRAELTVLRADAAAATARRRGAPRAAWQADVVALLGTAATGARLDEDRLTAALAGLDEVGQLEVWRSTALLAGATGRSDLRRAASVRAELMVSRCGSDADRVRAWVDGELRRLATSA